MSHYSHFYSKNQIIENGRMKQNDILEGTQDNYKTEIKGILKGRPVHIVSPNKTVRFYSPKMKFRKTPFPKSKTISKTKPKEENNKKKKKKRKTKGGTKKIKLRETKKKMRK
jgi:hypothetical protein